MPVILTRLSLYKCEDGVADCQKNLYIIKIGHTSVGIGWYKCCIGIAAISVKLPIFSRRLKYLISQCVGPKLLLLV